MNADGLRKGLDGVAPGADRLRAYIGILALQIADVQPCPLKLVGVHGVSEHPEAAWGGECERRVRRCRRKRSRRKRQ